jgi:ornithine cyclodeaminase
VAILARADARIVVEYEPQSRIEGEIQQLPGDFPVTEFFELLSGAAPGRLHEREVTIFDSVGFALEDFSALIYLHRLHREERAGRQQIDLLPELADPKDLYAALGNRQQASQPAALPTAMRAASR